MVSDLVPSFLPLFYSSMGVFQFLIQQIIAPQSSIEGVKLSSLLPLGLGATFFRALSATFCVTTDHDDKIIQRKCYKNLQVCEPTANTEDYDVLKSDIYQCTLHNTLQQGTGDAVYMLVNLDFSTFFMDIYII